MGDRTSMFHYLIAGGILNFRIDAQRITQTLIDEPEVYVNNCSSVIHL